VNPVQVYLIRHGETAWSLSGQHTGRSDIPLTEHGEAEARELAPRLTGIPFSAVLVSPRQRALRTCELAGLARGSEIDPDLAEWDFGDYEGQLSTTIRKTYPEWNAWRDGSPGGELPADVTIQTKVYESDCEPDARYNTLLGQAKPHTQLVEYQVTGQTTGRFYFPASVVDHMASTLKKSFGLIGPEGGTEVGPGGTHQSNYTLYDDILNSINVYAWRELSWNVNASLDKIWMDWAVPIYGPEAAPHVVKALRLSEEATYRTFSPLGMGSSTNSDFAGNIARRESLLRYTNRYYLPEYAKYLEPNKENIRLVVEEKAACLAKIEEMMRELELAKPHLTQEQAAEMETRFRWFQEFAIVNTTLDESLWRYRYLRHLAEMLTTDPEQMNAFGKSLRTLRTDIRARAFSKASK